MTLQQVGSDPISLLSSTHDGSVPEENLMTVAYARVQQDHPDFMAKHEGFDQDIRVSLSTFIFHAAPEPVISLYDFIMTTFVPEKSISPPPPDHMDEKPHVEESQREEPSRSSKIRVAVNLASVQGTSLARLRYMLEKN